MNYKKIALFALLIPVITHKTAQAQPWYALTYKKAGVLGSAIALGYFGYRAAQAYGADLQTCKNWLHDKVHGGCDHTVAALRAEIAAKTAESAKLVTQLKEAQEIAVAALREETNVKIAESARLATQLRETQDIAANQKRQSEQNLNSQRGIIELRNQEVARLTKELRTNKDELAQLRAAHDALQRQSTQVEMAQPAQLPVVEIEPIIGENKPELLDLDTEYRIGVRTDLINMASMLDNAHKAFDAIAPIMVKNQMDVRFTEINAIVKQAYEIASSLKSTLLKDDAEFKKESTVTQAQEALATLQPACDKIVAALPIIKETFNKRINNEYTRFGKMLGHVEHDQRIKDFDAFIFSFEQQVKQFNEIKPNTLTQ